MLPVLIRLIVSMLSHVFVFTTGSLLENTDHQEIAAFISKHLKIAYISPDDASRLDFELGLRTSMPDGWQWGDDILARLKEGNISL